MFKSLHSAKAQAKENKSLTEGELSKILDEGYSLFNDFVKTRNTRELKMAADKFFTYLKSKRSKPEPYFYLSTIFYLFEEKAKAVEYMKAVEEVDPAFKDLPALRHLIFG